MINWYNDFIMTLRQYIIALALGTAISISAWCIVMLAIDPAHAGTLGFIIFYITLGAGIAGLFTIIGTMIRARNYDDADVQEVVARSFRQGVMLSALFMSCLGLLSKGLFSFGTMLILVVLVGLVEFLMLSVRKGGGDDERSRS
jgi:hypothetical protein